MKISRFLSVVALALVTLSTASCNKEAEPIVLTGTWNIDSTMTFVSFVYDQVEADANPVTRMFLADINNQRKIVKALHRSQLVPNKIEFSATNTVVFRMKNGSSLDGTYTKYEDMLFMIITPLLPNGQICASDNKLLELYYPRDFVIQVINSILTSTDPSPEDIERIIADGSGGAVVYRR
ncbi:MAG: hypothetical protein RBT35_05335 [Bacteroidales bacterium]|jgi:hypothetical protein|nr:hypothetical protein [Bacteroidales bacterium]